MNPFGPTVTLLEKTRAEHPWSRRIKDAYSHKIRYAHNSIRNPEYPEKVVKIPPDKKCTRFTIIGDRVTKEFIHCVNLVRGLSKYRKNIFKTPLIQGVTTVEWPAIWNDLKIRFGGLTYALRSSVAVLVDDKFLGGEKELRELVESKFIYNLCLDYPKESIAEFAKFIRGSGRPCAYMNIAIDSKPIGTLIFMLYADVLPHTCANFLRLCKETRGGYSGTPIHRIVKDGWIQGGGFGLKETDLNCENFIIPHDRRGVLCMANSGLHMDCSTQFFILLQPASWMDKKFVAFGQLIEGKGTLDTIEAVPTWYESPTSEITIYKAGIFSMDCHGIMINKGTYEYIDMHIDDSNDFGDLLYEELVERVFVSALLRELKRLEELEGEGGEEDLTDREIQSYKRQKEKIKKQLQIIKTASCPTTTSVSRQTTTTVHRPVSASSNENNEFDVETYDPEYEETNYQHQSVYGTPSLIVKPKKPFYLPLIDVLYPEEKDSHFDLKRFLQGDYCLESDLKDPAKTFIPRHENFSYTSEQLFIEEMNSEDSDEDSEGTNEIKEYLRNNVDRLSFAGDIVKSIADANEKTNIFEETRKSELITDDQLRRLRLASVDIRSCDRRDKKVSISIPSQEGHHSRINRRQTGIISPDDLATLKKSLKHELDDNDDEEDDDTRRKVRIATSNISDTLPPVKRRVTPFVKPTLAPDNADDEDDNNAKDYDKAQTEGRLSILLRLFDEYEDDESPTLKDYKPKSESKARSLLTFSPSYPIKSENEGNKEKYIRQAVLRPSITANRKSFEVLNFQHGKKTARKISSDYVQTIDYIEHKTNTSLRSIEYSKMRPSLSVSEYQIKNKIYQEAQKAKKHLESRGLRLPGDSPLYHSEISNKN